MALRSSGTDAQFFRNMQLDVIGANDLTTKISDIFYSNTFSSNPVILAGICDALKYFSDHGQQLDEKTHVRAAMKYLNAVGGVILLDVLSREEICKIVMSRIISMLKGQSGDIDIEEDDEDRLVVEVIEEDDYVEDAEDEGTNDEKSDEYELEEFDDSVDEEKSEKDKQSKQIGEVPLNWFVEEKIDGLPRPEFITYGCWVKVYEKRNNSVIIYHIPQKDDKSRKWYMIEEKLMGKDNDFTLFLAGKHYIVQEFGRDDDDREDTKPEFCSAK